MRVDPFQIVRDFEAAVAEYAGVKHCIAVNSCTMALLLACRYRYITTWDTSQLEPVKVPKRTYVSVPMSVIHAGYEVEFTDLFWHGMYKLEPLNVWDSARLFSKNMYQMVDPGDLVCLSFHTTKVLGDTQGGAILTDNDHAAKYLKELRFDGRTEGVHPKQDRIAILGYHCYMSPDVAARLMMHFNALENYNPPLPNDDYPDLSLLPLFSTIQ